MKKNKNRSTRTLIFVLFCLIVGIFVILPKTGIGLALASWQETVYVPSTRYTPPQNGPVQWTSPQATNVQPAPTVATFPGPAATPNPLATPGRVYSQLAGLSSADPMQRFVEKIRDSEDDEAKQEAIEQAKAALEKHYDKYIEGYEQQVDEMESRLQKLRDQLNKRKDAKDRLVGLKLEMITSQAEGIGWPGETDQPNTQRFPRGTLTPWRTSPWSPAFRSAPREIPAPAAAVEPPNVYSRSAAPLRAMQSVPRSTSVESTRTDTLPSLATVPQTSRTYSTITGPVARTPKAKTSANFATYFQTGIRLLEQEEYGEFLDRYLQPDQFREELRSATLDEFSKKFQEESADSILFLFRRAADNPIVRTRQSAQSLIWQATTDEGEKRRLILVRGEGDHWYLSLREPEETEHQTR